MQTDPPDTDHPPPSAVNIDSKVTGRLLVVGGAVPPDDHLRWDRIMVLYGRPGGFHHRCGRRLVPYSLPGLLHGFFPTHLGLFRARLLVHMQYHGITALDSMGTELHGSMTVVPERKARLPGIEHG